MQKFSYFCGCLTMPYNYGTYNVADAGACTMMQFAEIIRNKYRRNYQVEDSNVEYYIAKNRALDTSKLAEKGFEEPVQWLINLGKYRRDKVKEHKCIEKRYKIM